MILRKNNFRKFSITNSYLMLFALALIFQYMFWKSISDVRVKLEVVPLAPNEKTIKAFTFGDDEFYFRMKVFKVQNMGDTFGRFTPLREYDMSRLYDWFIELEKLNYKSNYLPSLAAYYFSQTQNIEDKIYMINFLRQHAIKNPQKKWWWLYQAIFIANYGMKNVDLAIEIAYELKNLSPKTAPIWTKQMVAILLEQKGYDCEALRVINEIIEDIEKNGKKEEQIQNFNYMNYFIKNKLKELKEKNFDINSCIKNGE